MTDQAGRTPTAEEIVAHLKTLLGDEFVNWVIGDPAAALAPNQAEVARILLHTCMQSGSAGNELSPRLLMHPLLGYRTELRDSLVNRLRAQAAGEHQQHVEDADDHLLNALQRLCVDSYGELLLPDDTQSVPLMSSHNSPAGTAVMDAVRQEADFPFDLDAEMSDSVGTMRSTGSGGGLQLVGVGPSLVAAAFDRACAGNPQASIEDVLGELPTVLATARSVCRGERGTTLAMASLTGVLLPVGTEIDFS